MKIPQLTKCCLCATVQSGTYIIASLGITVYLLEIILVCATTVDPRIFVHNLRDPHTAKIACIIIAAISTLICGLLLLGAIYKNTTMMLPWVVVVPVSIIVTLLSTLVAIILLLVKGFLGSAFGVLIVSFIIIGINTYAFLVVYSYYRELQDEKRNTSQYAATWNP